jgi:hypothetical protein
MVQNVATLVFTCGRAGAVYGAAQARRESRSIAEPGIARPALVR